ncbi:MAG: hypothetical protein NTW78_04890 [Campylobacterales bacterium]|nr:hypothetical protein [Campylobacterales bacterium]
MNPLIFGLIFLAIFFLLNFYIYKRLILKLDVKKRVKDYLTIFLIINFIGLIGYILARYYLNIPNWLYFLLSLPIGILFLLFCTAIIYDASRVLLSNIPISKS